MIYALWFLLAFSAPTYAPPPAFDAPAFDSAVAEEVEAVADTSCFIIETSDGVTEVCQ